MNLGNPRLNAAKPSVSFRNPAFSTVINERFAQNAAFSATILGLARALEPISVRKTASSARWGGFFAGKLPPARAGANSGRENCLQRGPLSGDRRRKRAETGCQNGINRWVLRVSSSGSHIARLGLPRQSGTFWPKNEGFEGFTGCVCGCANVLPSPRPARRNHLRAAHTHAANPANPASGLPPGRASAASGRAPAGRRRTF